MLSLAIELFAQLVGQQTEYVPYTFLECDYGFGLLVEKVNKVSDSDRARQFCQWSLRTLSEFELEYSQPNMGSQVEALLYENW